MTAQSSATSSQRVDKLLETINTSTTAWKGGGKRARNDVVSACFQLAQELEEPSEVLTRVMWQVPSQLSAIRTGLDLDLFQHVNAEGPAKSTTQLAEAVNADPALMARILRVLASTNVIRETEADHFTSSPMSIALVDPGFVAAVKYCIDFHVPTNLGTSGYLRENNFQNPSDWTNTPIQYTHGGKGEVTLFQVLHQQGHIQGFQALMKEWCKHLPHWSDAKVGFYPIHERLIQGAKKGSDEVFIVDVGGGTGIDFIRLLDHNPKDTIPGSLVLQDLPLQIDSIAPGSLPEIVKPMAHDFFTPQPIKGARAYFFHAVIHDHTDDRAKTILKQIANAMTPGYSKLLIWDYVLADEDVSSFLAALDWQMLVCVAGTERTESKWRRLLEDPELGLKVNGIWSYNSYTQGLIEAELK